MRPAVQGALDKGSYRENLRGVRALRDVPNVVDALLNATVKTLTAPSINKTKEDLANIRKDLRATNAAWREYLTVVAFQRVLDKALSDLRGSFGELKSRADALRALCNEQVRTPECGAALEKTLASAEAAHKGATSAAEARRKQAADALAAERKNWAKRMQSVRDKHQELRVARDALAETEYLNRNRDRIRDLAFKASSADIRDKYRKEWDRLQTRKPVADYKARVDRLTAERAALWNQIESNQGRIAQLSRTALDTYRETTAAVASADNSYLNAISAARSKLVDCLGQREKSVNNKSKTLVRLRASTGQKTLVPWEILVPTRDSFETLNQQLAKTKIRVEVVEGANCKPIASRIDGCWFDVSRKGDDYRGDPVTIQRAGNRVMLQYTNGNRVFAGTMSGNKLSVSYNIKSAVELGDAHWWAGEKAPPMKVVQQAYPNYRVAKKDLSLNSEQPDILSGVHHGGYVNWNKTTLKMNSFENREYQARFVRGDKPKLRSIAFVDGNGKRRGTQSLSDSFRISAKGVAGSKAIVDIVKVKAYLDNDKDKFVWAELRETGPDTLVFEGTISQIPALTSCRAQGSVKQVIVFDPKGLRGSPIKVTP